MVSRGGVLKFLKRNPFWLVPVLILLLAMVILRFWVASHTDFETDEAYYWLWSRQLASSYFDHPPMVAYFIRLGTMLFGDTILAVRSMAVEFISTISRTRNGDPIEPFRIYRLKGYRGGLPF